MLHLMPTQKCAYTPLWTLHVINYLHLLFGILITIKSFVHGAFMRISLLVIMLGRNILRIFHSCLEGV